MAPPSRFDGHLNQALGWLSVGAGLVELLAPRSLGQLIGTGEHSALLRMCGAREIASGIALLSRRAPAASAFSRVAGDAMDLALLGAALRSPNADPKRLMLAATTVLGVSAVDIYAAGRQTGNAFASASATESIGVSIAINSSPQKLYEFWRDFTNFPRFIQHLHAVTGSGEQRSHWIVRGPSNSKLEWDSEIVEDQPHRLIAWRTLPGSELPHHGKVTFQALEGDRGTLVHVQMHYGLPGGALGAALARVLGRDPKGLIKQDLRRLKQLLETGEIATTRGQSAGSRSLVGRRLTRRES